jgi:putative sigma-54 modulation protein
MKIEYTGRNIDIPRNVKALAERKLRKIETILGRVDLAHVVLAADKHRRFAEVTIASPRLALQASDESTDVGVSLARVLDKLARQAQRRIGKYQARRRNGRESALWAGIFAGAPSEAAQGPRLVSTRRLLVRLMSVTDAVNAVSQSEDDFLVFRDSRTARVSVVYKRKDGGLGLLEPEV